MREPILALEGALGGFSVAIASGPATFARGLEGRAALEEGLGAVEALFAEAGLTLHQLGGIAVGTGPGGFTGLRIAISYAKSLALGATLPLAGISSFDILDAAAQATSSFPRLTVVRGRTGIVCIRRSDSDRTRVACGAIEATVARVTDGDDEVTIVGATEDVRSAVGERAKSVLILSAGAELPAATLAHLARDRAPAASAHAVAPDYGELPAAKMR